jgi:hypothetical protein
MEQIVIVEEVQRPPTRKPVDKDLIYKLAAIHCTNKEIASITGVHYDSLQRHYKDILVAGRENGKGKLRRKMWEEAMKGNVTMMIWLSKNYLGMTDHVMVSDDKKPLPWVDDDIKAAEEPADTSQDSVIIYTEVHEDLDTLQQDLKGV